MRKIALLALLVTAGTAGTADAGPLRDRLRARFAPAPCASGQCAPAVAFRPAAPVAAAPVTVAVPVASSCPGGVCPAPVVVRRGLFR